MERGGSAAGWFLSAFDFTVITGVHLITVLGDLLATLETRDFPEPIGLDGGNIVIGKNTTLWRHDIVVGFPLNNDFPTSTFEF